MWGKKATKAKAARIGTWIGEDSELSGDIRFSGGLHVEGKVTGNVIAEDADALLMVSEKGRIEGEVRVPNIVLNGSVTGDVHADEHVELGASARVTGNVFYHLIEMAMGAEVNGNLVHRGQRQVQSAKPQPVRSQTTKAEQPVKSPAGGLASSENS